MQDTQEVLNEQESKKLSRAQRRAEQRFKEKEALRTIPQLEKSVKGSNEFLNACLNLYQELTNKHLASKAASDPQNPVIKMEFELEQMISSVPEQALRDFVAKSGPVADFDKMMQGVVKETEPGGETVLKIAYIRVIKNYFLKEGHDVEARPEAGETLKYNKLTKIFYHAFIPVKNTDQFTALSNQFKLLDDLIRHLILNGIEYQERIHEENYQRYVQESRADIKSKVDEVNDIFDNAVKMKVTKNEDNKEV